MAIVNVKKMWSPTASTVLGWTVLLDGTDTLAAEPSLAEQGPGIPQKGEAHPAVAGFVAQKPEADAIGPHFYRVIVRYSEARGGGTAEAEPENPLARRAGISWDLETTTEPIESDIEGKPIMNSAGEPFDPPIEMPFSIPILRIARNEAQSNIAQIIAYAGGRGATNTDSFFGAQPHEALCRIIRESQQVEGTYTYWRREYEFAFRQVDREKGLVGWSLRMLNQGYRIDTGDDDADGNPIYELIKDASGVPLSEPACLSEDGKKVVRKENAVWLEFRPHPQLSFGALGLP